MDEVKKRQPELHVVMLSTVETAVMEMGVNMESLFLHQAKDKTFTGIIHSKFYCLHKFNSENV